MAKYLVISDIHGSERFLERILSKNQDATCVIVCGDLEMEFYDVEEIIRRETSRSMDIRMVRGNCDSYFTSSSGVPDVITVPLTSKHRALVTHSHIYHASTNLMAYAAMEKECDTVIYGHTHRQVDKTECGIRFLNPGALRNVEYLTITTDAEGGITVSLFGS